MSSYEEALDMLEGTDPARPIEAEAELLEPAVAMLRGVPREAWKAPMPPRLDLEAVTGRKGAQARTVLREPSRKSSRSSAGGFFGSWPRLAAAGFAAAALIGIGAVLGVSKSTVDRDWRFARTWLATRLSNSD